MLLLSIIVRQIEILFGFLKNVHLLKNVHKFQKLFLFSKDIHKFVKMLVLINNVQTWKNVFFSSKKEHIFKIATTVLPFASVSELQPCFDDYSAPVPTLFAILLDLCRYCVHVCGRPVHHEASLCGSSPICRS